MMDANVKAAPGAAPSLSEDKRQFVTFALGGQNYCIDIMLVREIRMVQSITGLPGAPEHVRGVINLRGCIVPVYDLRRKFGQGETHLQANHPSVIVDVDGKLCGLLVDEVLDIVTVASNEIAALPEDDVHDRNPYFEGFVTHKENLFIVVDIHRFIETPDVSEIETLQ